MIDEILTFLESKITFLRSQIIFDQDEGKNTVLMQEQLSLYQSLFNRIKTNIANLPEPDENVLVLMGQMGGNFARNIAKAWVCADSNNKQRLMVTFGDLYKKYETLLSQSRNR